MSSLEDCYYGEIKGENNNSIIIQENLLLCLSNKNYCICDEKIDEKHKKNML